MPSPVTPWVSMTPVTAKSLDTALYASDGTADNPNGIASAAYRPILYETCSRAGTFPSTVAGTATAMSSSGSITTGLVVYDTAGYFGQTQDLPGAGYYQYTSVIDGSDGDGVTPGGWMVVTHFAALKPTATQTALGADFIPGTGTTLKGGRQAPQNTNDNCAFICDLANVGQVTWQPAVFLADSGSASAAGVVNVTDSSGETCRMAITWAGVSASSQGQASFTTPGVYSFPAPKGVTSITAAPTGAGGGGGSGNVSSGGAEYGGGGAGAGEFAKGSVAVTPLNNYPVTVGAAGAGGVNPGDDGGAGGTSSFSGDSASVTGHGGHGGKGATTSTPGAAGAGGTGSSATTHHDGGAGAAGTPGAFGGGAGSSAGTTQAGAPAMGADGGDAPLGGGPGGDGGAVSVTIVQTAQGSNTNHGTLKVNFGSAVQAGNGVIVCINQQAGSGTTAVTLSDGTALSSAVSNEYSSSPPFGASIWAAFGVAGGETSLTVDSGGTGGGDTVILAQALEVSGLGASPNQDSSNSASANASSYSVTNTTTGSPDLWVGAVGAQLPSSGTSISAPGGSWTAFGQISGTSKFIASLRSGYQVATTAGSEKYSGSISRKSFNVAVATAWTVAAVTPGTSPLTGPGGGGGAGLGSGSGAAGAGGQVLLTWTGVSGGGYGTPPLPEPYTNWNAATQIGTSTNPNADVDINGPAGITGVLNFLANPPLLRVSTLAGQSITTATLTAVTFTSAPDQDNYGAWSTGTSTWTVPRDGVYLCHGVASFAQHATGTRQAGITVNGTTYWGPGHRPASAGSTGPSKTQIFSLLAGDTVQFACRQDSGATVALSTTDQSRFMAVWLCAPGMPAQPWTPPDTTFRWVTGTPGAALPALQAQHLGNDLSFLVQRPFLLAYQTVAQTGLNPGGGSSGGSASFVKRIGAGAMNSSSATSFSVGVSSATTGTGTLIVQVAFGNQAGTVTGITDTKGNTWSHDYSVNTTTTAGRGLEFWHCSGFTALATTDSLTITLSATQDHGAAAIIDQYSSLQATDAQNFAYQSSSSSTSNSVTVAATSADSLVIGALLGDKSSVSPSVASPFTASGAHQASNTGSSGVDLLPAYDTSPPSGGGNVTASFTLGSGASNVAAAVAYPATSSSGSAVFNLVTLDTVAGIVHGDDGDTYDGWNAGANAYVAQTPGWYLAVAEVFTSSSANAGAVVTAAFVAPTSGGAAPSKTPDWYQSLAATATASVGGGATAIGIYYLLENESISLAVQGVSFTGTYSTLAGASNSGQVNCSLGAVWLSE